MTISDEISKLQSNLANSYASCNNKGATMPSSRNFDNLATTINSIPTGGGDITPTGTISITENGTYDVTNYASANVNVEGSGGGGISFPAGTNALMFSGTIESEQLKGAFQHLTSTEFITKNNIWEDYGSYGHAKSKALQEAFKGNQHTTKVSFFAIRYFDATDVLLDCFVDSVVSTITFNRNVRSEIVSQTGYVNKWGAPTATIKYEGDPE